MKPRTSTRKKVRPTRTKTVNSTEMTKADFIAGMGATHAGNKLARRAARKNATNTWKRLGALANGFKDTK